MFVLAKDEHIGKNSLLQNIGRQAHEEKIVCLIWLTKRKEKEWGDRFLWLKSFDIDLLQQEFFCIKECLSEMWLALGVCWSCEQILCFGPRQKLEISKMTFWMQSQTARSPPLPCYSFLEFLRILTVMGHWRFWRFSHSCAFCVFCWWPPGLMKSSIVPQRPISWQDCERFNKLAPCRTTAGKLRASFHMLLTSC